MNFIPIFSPPRKIPFARPMDKWLSNWSGPINDVFRSDINLSMFSGDQKWLIYSLDKFISLILREKIYECFNSCCEKLRRKNY